MKLRYDRREDRLVLTLSGEPDAIKRYLITRRMWLQWVQAMGDEATDAARSAPALAKTATSGPDEELTTVLVTGIRLRKREPHGYRLGLVHEKQLTSLYLDGPALTNLLSILISLGKVAGWDLESALARMGPAKTPQGRRTMSS